MWTNVDEIETLIGIYATNFPLIAERIALPEKANSVDSGVAPRTVTALRIGTHGANDADGALLLFGHHAREWVPPEVALELIGGILEAYSANIGLAYNSKIYSAADVKRIVENINLFIVPCVNPHGRQFSLDNDTVDDGWRKNRGDVPNSSQIGVDLNRNYDFAFDLPKHFALPNSDLTIHTSDQPSTIVYQGPTPFSEPETRNIRWLLDAYARIRWFVDVHGFTRFGEIYHPWGDDLNQSTDPAMNWRNPAFDHQRGLKTDTIGEFISAGDLATHKYLANRFKAGADPVNNQSYIVRQSFELYPTAGCSDDYAWSRHLVSSFLPRVEGFAIEHRATKFKPEGQEYEDVVKEVTSGLVNFCLACACGVPGLTVELRTQTVVFNHCPEGRISSRSVILQVTGCEAATFRILSGPTQTGGAGRVDFGVAIASQAVPGTSAPVTRDLYVWLTCSGGRAGDTATGTVQVECPEAGFVANVTLTADFVAAPLAGAVLVLDRSGSMTEDGGDGRTRLQILQESAPAFVDLAPQGARVGLVRFSTDEAPGSPMTTMGPEGPDPGGRDVIRDAIINHTIATGDARFTSIGDGVFAGNDLIAPETGVDFKSLVVLTDGIENRSRYLSEVASLINDRVFAIGLGTPEQIQPIALKALTNGTNGYLLMTGAMDVNDPFRLAKYYLQILTGVTNSQVVLDPGGWLAFGAAQSIPFYLNEADSAVDAIVLAAFPQRLRIRLRAPSGQILDAAHPAMMFTRGERNAYYRFALPVPGAFSAEGPGRWEILLDWGGKLTRTQLAKMRSAPMGMSQTSMRYDALVHARSDLEMAATLAQDRLTPGATVTVRARLSHYQSIPLDNARVVARVRYPDGSGRGLGLGPQGDGVFEGRFLAPMTGVYPVRITAQGQSLRGFRFVREAVRTAFVWEGGDSKQPTRHDDGWCGLLRCLIENKALDPELLKRLGINIEQLMTCCEVEEGTPILKMTKKRPPAGSRSKASKRASD